MSITSTELLTLNIYHSKSGYTGYIGEKNLDTTFWRKYTTISVISPSFRPLPPLTGAFSIIQNKEYPYNTTGVELIYDIGHSKGSFIAYTTPVQHTIGIYLYKMGKNIYPSLDIDPPTDSPEWEKELLPIFYAFRGSESRFLRFELTESGLILPTIHTGMFLRDAMSLKRKDKNVISSQSSNSLFFIIGIITAIFLIIIISNIV